MKGNSMLSSVGSIPLRLLPVVLLSCLHPVPLLISTPRPSERAVLSNGLGLVTRFLESFLSLLPVKAFFARSQESGRRSRRRRRRESRGGRNDYRGNFAFAS